MFDEIERKRNSLALKRLLQTKEMTTIRLGSLLSSSLMLILLFHAHILPNVVEAGKNTRGLQALLAKDRKQRFKPGPWKDAHATFYGGMDGSGMGGACGYENVEQLGYGMKTTALSSVLFKDGLACGSCYEIKCVNEKQWCTPGQPSLFVTATNHCPPGSDGGWCNPPREHFDLAKAAFLQIADYKAGIVPVQYRRVPCKKQGGIRFTISGNPHFNLVSITNVGGAGDVTKVEVKGDKGLPWTRLKHNWGQKWETDAMLQGETLTFRVTTSDGRVLISRQLAPSNWQFGQTFEGKNFR